MKEHPFVKISGDKIIRKGFLDVPDREIGEVRESAESSVAYFENRFSILEQKVGSLEKNIEESDNKGSFLMKLLHLKEYIARFDGIGDFEKLYQRLDEKEKFIREIIHENRIRNYEVKKNFLNELETLKDHYNLKEAGERIKEIRQEWIRTGAVLEEHRKEIEDKFNEYTDHFNERRKAFYNDRKMAMEDTAGKYEEILRKADRLNHLSDLRESTRRLKALQLEWKNLGRIPAEKYNQLRERFQKINDDIFGRFRQQKETQSRIREKNEQYLIDQKARMLKEIWEKIEDGSHNLFQIKQDYLYRWKKLGNFYTRDIQELNDRFFSRILYINEVLFVEKLARKMHADYDRLESEEKKNLKIGVLKELIERDEKEIETYDKNMDAFSFRQGSDKNVFRNKRNDKQKALHVKKELMKSFLRDIK